MQTRPTLLLVLTVVALTAACTLAGRETPPDRVTLQLKWVTQAQFAGYYAAQARGFYRAERLLVSVRAGGPDIDPEEVVDAGRAEIGVGWMSSLLAARDRGLDLINVAQIFSQSGMREISFKTAGIRGPADLKGKRVGVWLAGNQHPLFATLEKYGLDRERDLTIVRQPFDMKLLLERKVDAAAAMTYNELRQVLDAGVPIYDLAFIDFNKEGTAMLEDGLFASGAWLAGPRHRDIAARFLRASLRGWAHCRDYPKECVDIVLAESPVLGRPHQEWMMAEVNKLIWPSPDAHETFGRLDAGAFKQTADIALRYGVIRRPPDARAWTHDIWDAAKRP